MVAKLGSRTTARFADSRSASARPKRAPVRSQLNGLSDEFGS